MAWLTAKTLIVSSTVHAWKSETETLPFVTTKSAPIIRTGKVSFNTYDINRVHPSPRASHVGGGTATESLENLRRARTEENLAMT